MSEWVNIPGEDGTFRYTRTSFYGAGRDAYTQPPAQNPDMFSEIRNTLPVTNGVMRRRWGMTAFASSPANLTDFWNVHLYENPSSAKRRLLFAGSFSSGATYRILTYDENGTLKNVNVFTSAASGGPFSRFITSRNYVYHLDQAAADLFKYDGNDTSGSGVTTWGIAAPTGAASAALNGAAGNVTINRYRHYYYAYYNSTTGAISDVSPIATGPTAPFSAQKVDLTGITVDSNSANSGTTRRVVLATSDGGPLTRLYLLTTLADNTTTTYTDNTAEEDLLRAAVYTDLGPNGERLGILGNQPAPNGKYVIKHRGRIYIIGTNDKLYFSKSIAEVSTASGLEVGGRYEECFPSENVLDISPEVETVTGVLSDGINLYIGTRRNVYRLVGDGPSTYEPIQVALREVGVTTDLCWKTIYVDGTPVGAMWLTPDYRVVFSDFNTYKDIGLPITDALKGLATWTLVTAVYASSAEYNIYAIAAVDNPASLYVYSIPHQKWFRWTLGTDSSFVPSINVDSQFFWMNPVTLQPQWIITCFPNRMMLTFSNSTTTDPVLGGGTLAIRAQLQTEWLDFGLPLTRKALNKIELTTKQTGASDCTVTVEAAETDAQFTSPVTIVSGATLVLGPTGDYRIPLSGYKTKYRWYRITINFPTSSSATTDNILEAMAIEWTPLQAI